MKQSRFIDEKPDPRERQIAREQLEQMIHYAEAAECRRGGLLRYFGEKYAEPNCGACDNCLAPRDTFDGTLAAQKFLSCVYRVHEKSGFSVGMNHIVEVLTGADTEKVRKWNHAELSTYGIGKEHGRREWSSIGRELIRLGYLRQLPEKFNVLELTDEGRQILRARKPVSLTRPMKSPELQKERQVGQISCDEQLFEVLRQLRKRLADAEGVPSYIIFSDVALRQMARFYPASEQEFSRISGVGQKKLAEYGVTFLAEIAHFLKTNPRQIFADDLAPETRAALTQTAFETLRRFRAGASVEQIASERGLVTSTIYGHLATAVESGETLDLRRFFRPEDQPKLAAAFQRFGYGNLTGVHEALQGKFDMAALRLYRAAAQNSSRQQV